MLRQHTDFPYRATMRLFNSSSMDPFSNLAMEDVLLDRAEEFAPLLLFYVNRPCVVIGKNQVPWRDCQTGRLREEGVPMARRISGGGTVFHDEGNLNYSFILPRDSYKQAEIFVMVLRALASLGIRTHVGANHGLFCDDRKFSGSAFCFRRQHVLHHGTLLIETDLEKLRRFCVPALPQISTRAVASKPAHVVNLCELSAAANIESVSRAIVRESGACGNFLPDQNAISARADELRGWDFLWGQTPAFEIQIADNLLRIERGIVVASALPDLVGARFSRDDLARAKFPGIGKEVSAFFQSL